MFKYGIDHLTVDKVLAIANGNLKAEITGKNILLIKLIAV